MSKRKFDGTGESQSKQKKSKGVSESFLDTEASGGRDDRKASDDDDDGYHTDDETGERYDAYGQLDESKEAEKWALLTELRRHKQEKERARGLASFAAAANSDIEVDINEDEEEEEEGEYKASQSPVHADEEQQQHMEIDSTDPEQPDQEAIEQDASAAETGDASVLDESAETKADEEDEQQQQQQEDVPAELEPNPQQIRDRDDEEDDENHELIRLMQRVQDKFQSDNKKPKREKKAPKPDPNRFPGEPIPGHIWQGEETDDEKNSRNPNFCGYCRYSNGRIKSDGALDFSDMWRDYVHNYLRVGRFNNATRNQQFWDEHIRPYVREPEYKDMPFRRVMIDKHFHEHEIVPHIELCQEYFDRTKMLKALSENFMVPDSLGGGTRVPEVKRMKIWNDLTKERRKILREIHQSQPR